jgi:hypothetical protein
MSVEPPRPGMAGVFAGDWALTDSGRVPVGFAGVLVEMWNGWAVFSCTREVVEAIVADQREVRAAFAAHLAATGTPEDDVAAEVDQAVARMSLDGHDIVIDETRVHDDPDAITRTTPGDDGRYIVGWGWTWIAVDPAACDRVVGTPAV